MSSVYETGAEGEQLLAEYLTRRGRTVEVSETKTFDLLVEGRYAEVKTSLKPYAQLGFVGLTQNQYEALERGVEFSLFLVCNLAEPERLEVIEIPASGLLNEPPKRECTYYWYRSQLNRLIDSTE